jgi:hypothetical protein
MSGFKLPGLSISSNPIAVYHTKLTADEIKAIERRLYNFNFNLPINTQYTEIESIANILNNAQENERDEMELGLVLTSIEAQKRGRKVDKPENLLNVLLKVTERITPKPAVGGRRSNLPRRFFLPGKPPLQPIRQTRGTMSAAEAAQKQRFFRQNFLNKTRKIKTNRAINDENYGNVVPVTNAFNIPVGNANNSRTSRASSAANVYNLFNRPRHKAAWNAVFSNTKKGGTRKKLPKSNTPEFRKQVINMIRAKINLTKTHKNMLIQRYTDAANAGLATPDEISALVSLAELKHYTPRTLRRRK